jgi:large conductance mechanosensitive channel
MKKFFKDFGEFIQRGNVMDMAVGVVIGTAFSAIVTSLVNDMIMPLISLATGGVDFSNLFISLNGQTYETLAAAQEAGASVLAYGNFIQAIVNFLIIALCIFITLRIMKKAQDKLDQKLKKEKKEEEAKKADDVVLLEEIRDLLKKQSKK